MAAKAKNFTEAAMAEIAKSPALYAHITERELDDLFSASLAAVNANARLRHRVRADIEIDNMNLFRLLMSAENADVVDTMNYNLENADHDIWGPLPFAIESSAELDQPVNAYHLYKAFMIPVGVKYTLSAEAIQHEREMMLGSI